MEIKKEFENKLLKRKEYELVFDSKATTLSRKEVKELAIKALKADESLLVVDSIKSYFGSTNSTARVYVYDNEEILNKLTPSYILKRNETLATEVSSD